MEKKSAEEGRPSWLGEAPRIALVVIPVFLISLVASLIWPGQFPFTGKWWGLALVAGIELAVVGIVFWIFATIPLLKALREGSLATRGSYALCRHPIFSWWIFFILPSLALIFNSWLFLLSALVFFFSARSGALREEEQLLERFPAEYPAYQEQVRMLLPLPRIFPFSLVRYLRWALLLFLLVLFALGVFIIGIKPIMTSLGSSREERSMVLPGDEYIPRVRQGYTQAISIDAPAEELWKWLVQIGYKRAGWYNVDLINGLTADDYFYEGKGSVNRIIPELQKLEKGDKIGLVPGVELTVAELSEPNLLVLAGDPEDPSAEFNVSWTFLICPGENGSSRLVSRFRSTFPGGIGAELLNGFVNIIGGAVIQQPAMFHGIRIRAEGRGE